VVPTSEVRAAFSQITKRFDAVDPESVFFGSHRRAQAVLVPIASGRSCSPAPKTNWTSTWPVGG
jgi:hypothetical protein